MDDSAMLAELEQSHVELISYTLTSTWTGRTYAGSTRGTMQVHIPNPEHAM